MISMRKVSAAVFLASLALIALQIALMQALAQAQGHHFAFAVISLALLAFGCSGTILALARSWLLQRAQRVLPMLLLAAGLAGVPCLLYAPHAAAAADFHLLFVEWRAWLPLLRSAACVFVPFFCGALFLAMVFARDVGRIGARYGANLLGSAAGAGVGLAVLAVLPPESALILLLTPFLLAAPLTGAPHARRWVGPLAAGGLILVLAIVLLPLRQPLSAYKPISHSLRLPEARVTVDRPHPLGRIQVVTAPALRHGPGLSLSHTGTVPVAAHVYRNGEGYGALLPRPEAAQAHPYDAGIQALPLRLLEMRLAEDPGLQEGPAPSGPRPTRRSALQEGPAPSGPRPTRRSALQEGPAPSGPPGTTRRSALQEGPVPAGPPGTTRRSALHGPRPLQALALHPGGGATVGHLLHNGATVTVLEPHPLVATLLAETYAADLAADRLRLVIADGRAWLNRARSAPYDLIVLPAQGAFGGGMGLQAAQEDYLLTVEAVRALWQYLGAEGLLAVSLWLDQPPRVSLRLLATIAAMLRDEAIAEPGTHLMALRGWDMITLVVARGGFDAGDIAAQEAFARQMGFDRTWVPGTGPAPADTLHADANDPLGAGFSALLGPDPDAFQRAYLFNVYPARDDKPYFHQFIRLDRLAEVRRIFGAGTLAQVELGPVMVAATVVPLLLAALILILAPLLRLGWRGGGRLQVFGYYAAIGLGFMFLEIVWIQRFTLYWGHPLYSAAGVIAALLCGMGAGSLWSGRLGRLPPAATGEGNSVAARGSALPGRQGPAIGNPQSAIRPGRLPPAATGEGNSVAARGSALPGRQVHAIGNPQTAIQPGRLPPAATGAVGFFNLRLVLAGIVLWILASLWLLPWLFAQTLAWPAPARWVFGLALLAVPAVLLGMPFPLALRRLGATRPEQVPWAWGINGCFSVLAAPLAALLALQAGFAAVGAAAALAYLAAMMMADG
jgi:hypothetical protein